MIDKISNTIVNDKVKSVYGFNDYSIQDLLSKFFEHINSVTDLVNQNEEKINTQNFKLEEFINYMKNEGIPPIVIETVTTMYNDGRLTELFNTLANNVIDKVEEVKTQINSSLEQKAKKGKNIKIVSKEYGDYSTINEGIIAGGDTPENPLTLLLHPGTYKEYVYIKQWSRINLVGTNKKDCIVKTTEGDYLKPPLETCGERYIANITFIADHSETQTDPNTLKAYAFHGDKSTGGDGTTLVENCRFESYQNASVGLGIYNNQKFHFKNCEFYSKINYDSPQANVGAFYAHNSVTNGATNGELIFDNCEFFMDNDRSGYGYACYINDANLTNGDGLGNAIKVKFINCTLKRRHGEHVNAIRLDNTTSINNLSGSILLDKISNGNNIACLNYPQIEWNSVTLSSPIANVGSNFTPLRYSKDVNGKVRIEGTITGLTSGSTNTLFTLPVGYRPSYHKFYDIVNYSGSTPQIGKLLVNRSGVVTIEGTLNTTRTDICVEFYAEQ